MFFISHRYDTRLYLRQTQARLPISVARHQKKLGMMGGMEGMGWEMGMRGMEGENEMIGIGWAAAEPQLTEKKDEKLMKIEEGRKNGE